MSEPKPTYTTATDAGFAPEPDEIVNLASAYRAAVGAALQLQRHLKLPPDSQCVLEPEERDAYRRWREAGT